MDQAAHPQRDDEPADTAAGSEPGGAVVKNPFPSAMTVPGEDGQDLVVELSVVDGVVYAPGLDDLPIGPFLRYYVTQYCAAWSLSVLTVGKIEAGSPEPPRRVQVVFSESQLHAMLGLAGDERLVRTVVDQLTGAVHFVVESPRLPPQPFRDMEPLNVNLPIAALYEAPVCAQ